MQGDCKGRGSLAEYEEISIERRRSSVSKNGPTLSTNTGVRADLKCASSPTTTVLRSDDESNTSKDYAKSSAKGRVSFVDERSDQGSRYTNEVRSKQDRVNG